MVKRGLIGKEGEGEASPNFVGVPVAMASGPSISDYRMALGRTAIVTQDEYPTLVKHDDGRSWIAFAMREAYMNIALVQDEDEYYVKDYMKRALDTKMEHFFVLCGDAIKHRALFEKNYALDCDMPIMGAELASCENHMKYDDRVVECTREDRTRTAELLAEGFDTTVEAELAMASADGHASPLVVGFKIEEDGYMLGHVAIGVVGEFVGVWALSISERARRRGLATALFNHCLKYAYDVLGAKYGVLLASSEGAAVYERAGWKILENVPLYFTADSYVRIPSFIPNIIRPYLRIEHGRIAAEILKDVEDRIIFSDDYNWFCSPGSKLQGHALAQNARYEDVLSHSKRIADSGRHTQLVLAGPASIFAEQLVSDLCEIYPTESHSHSHLHHLSSNGASPDNISLQKSEKSENRTENKSENKKSNGENKKNKAEKDENNRFAFFSGLYRAMVYDLITDREKQSNGHQESNGNESTHPELVIRRGTAEDCSQISSLVKSSNKESNWICPFASNAKEAGEHIFNWVCESRADEKAEKSKIVGVATFVVRNRALHIWGVATDPECSNKQEIVSLILNNAIRHAEKETDARIAFLIASPSDASIYSSLGWHEIEEWHEITINAKQ